MDQKPTQAWGEHASTIQKTPKEPSDQLTVLTTAPPSWHNYYSITKVLQIL